MIKDITGMLCKTDTGYYCVVCVMMNNGDVYTTKGERDKQKAIDKYLSLDRRMLVPSKLNSFSGRAVTPIEFIGHLPFKAKETNFYYPVIYG